MDPDRGEDELAKSQYHDTFEAVRRPGDTRTAEEWFRVAFEGASIPLRWFMLVGWRGVLLLRIRSLSDRRNILGWPIMQSEPDSSQLQLESPLMTSTLGLHLEESKACWTTNVHYNNRLGKALWALAGPIHRKVVPARLKAAATPSKDSRR
ncbi:MAG: DUF2867 domain-containing protein [Acidimicrobiales bacterium]